MNAPRELSLRDRYRALRTPAAMTGAVILLALSTIALGVSVLAPYGKNEASAEITQSPSVRHWFGTDQLGKDVLTRTMYGTRLSLICGVAAIGLALAVGVPIGIAAGYFGAWTDALLMRAIDVLLAFPSVLIALLMAAAFRPGWLTVIAATALLNVPGVARQVRAVVLTVKHLDYVEAGRALGASTLRTLLVDILPSLAGPISALASIGIGTAILETAGLSFLGIGGDPTEPEWGTMLAAAKDYWSKNPWGAIGPGLAISLTVLGFHLTGAALHEYFAPETGRRTVR